MRVIHGKLKPGTWDAYEATYKDVMSHAEPIRGLTGRWLARDLDDPDAGYTMSVWESEEAMRAYESSEILKTRIMPRLSPFFAGDYQTKRCVVRHEWTGLTTDEDWPGSDS